MALTDEAEPISMVDAQRIGIATLILDAETGHDRIVLRNN